VLVAADAPIATTQVHPLDAPASRVARMVRIVGDPVGDWSHLDDRIENGTDEIEALARGLPQLMTVPSVGPNCKRNGGCGLQRHCLCKRARLCGVAWPGAEADVYR